MSTKNKLVYKIQSQTMYDSIVMIDTSISG